MKSVAGTESSATVLAIPASEGRRRARHVQACHIFLFAYKYDITHRLSQHLAALSRNSTEQGKRDNGDRGPGGDNELKRIHSVSEQQTVY